ncbi:Membrane protein insertase, YidC/Oxa1 family [uncultured Eubacteriales bacterium]|uniref:Membrane protein insertase, YidC/Oxa1 family n=1 Tax=uncultured Eubacteriales bacterium TaxID=172733 RepID=A0A212KJG3_9FIRM|nr:Membrane protein insertase, YidC/Oxa1 family [uncultured Eubacteriales bacterium]
MAAIMQIVLTPFSWLITVFNDLFGNYGAALILFALLVKLILFPLSIKGKRSMIQTNALSAKMNKLQKMYGNNKEKYNLEVQKLYEKENVNPMGGCLWSMLPLLILLPLYYIVREPLTYMMGLTADQITALLGALPTTVAQTGAYYQLTAADVLARSFSAVAANPAVAAFKDSLLELNFDFLGINLASTPNWKFWTDGISWPSVGLALMPIISAGTSFLFSFISMKTNAINQQSAQATNSTTKSMMFMSPIISLWIGFAMPASMSIYWIAQNIFSLLQEYLAGKILKKDYEKAAEDAKRREEEEKEEEKRQREIERSERSKRIEESKNKKKAPKKEEDDKIPASVKEASRVGIRAYARGRAYDPLRFSSDGAAPAPVESEAISEEKQETEEK